MADIKQEILAAIERKVSVFIKSNGVQYRIRCPYCGDSQSNPRDAHCYLKCSQDQSEPILFYCFKCNAYGMVTSDFLERLGISGRLSQAIANKRYNKIGVFKPSNIKLVAGNPIIPSPQIDYIEWRLGTGFTVEDYDRFKIVWDMSTIKPHLKQSVANRLPNNNHSVSFLSDDLSMLLCRSFTDDEPTWNKIRLFDGDGKSYYTIRTVMNLFTPDPYTVNIAEGVFDVLSIYKNFTDSPSDIFIATLGSNYISAVDYAISKGFIGKNVTLKIYIDWEVDEPSLKRALRQYKWLFEKIQVIKNTRYKDVGKRIEEIHLLINTL